MTPISEACKGGEDEAPSASSESIASTVHLISPVLYQDARYGAG
jgi:hypothetical protein